MMFRKLYLLFALTPACTLAAPPTVNTSAPMSREQAQAQSNQANVLRKQAKTRKGEIEAIRRHDYDACLNKFLVNSCRDDVQDTFIERMKDVRRLEIQANKMDRVAKARLKELDDEERQAPKPSGKTQNSDEQNNSHSSPLQPQGKARGPLTPLRTRPSPHVSPASQAQADAKRQRAIQAAEQQQSANNKAAAQRAKKAEEDRNKYDQRMQQHAEKMAKQKAKDKNSSNHSTKSILYK